MIYVVSDAHFGHLKNFLWQPRGFESSYQHDKTIIANWNSIVNWNDDVYFLGDLMLGDNDYGFSCARQLNGRIHLVRGNHDTNTRWNEVYPQLPNIVEFCGWATVIKYQQYHFYLSHFPADTANYDDDKPLKAKLISISGHTHKPEKFHNGDCLKYNAALDAHNNYPVLLDTVIEDIKNEMAH